MWAFGLVVVAMMVAARARIRADSVLDYALVGAAACLHVSDVVKFRHLTSSTCACKFRLCLCLNCAATKDMHMTGKRTPCAGCAPQCFSINICQQTAHLGGPRGADQLQPDGPRLRAVPRGRVQRRHGQPSAHAAGEGCWPIMLALPTLPCKRACCCLDSCFTQPWALSLRGPIWRALVKA